LNRAAGAGGRRQIFNAGLAIPVEFNSRVYWNVTDCPPATSELNTESPAQFNSIIASLK
jgi:hypothetical protein